MIDRSESDRIKAAVRLPDLIGETVPLARDGRVFIGRCPFHAERTGSFTVYADHYHCFGCGAHGDCFRWLATTRRMSFPEAVAHLGGGWQPAASVVPAERPRKVREAAPADFMRLWREGQPAAGTIVETYLRHRGSLSLPEGAPIQFHPRCQRGPRDLQGGPEYWPAMVALMTDPLSGAPVGLHRTYLRPDGVGKAPDTQRITADERPVILRAKRVLGTWGVIRLYPEEEIGRGIGLAEGIENALTAAQLIGWGPVWAAGCRDQIARFPVLPWADALTIFADADDSGEGLKASRECAKRWTAAGREALIYVPPAGQDWNDVMRRGAA